MYMSQGGNRLSCSLQKLNSKYNSRSSGRKTLFYMPYLLFSISATTSTALARAASASLIPFTLQEQLLCKQAAGFAHLKSKMKHSYSNEAPNADETLAITSFNILCPKYFKTTDQATTIARKEANLPENTWGTRNRVVAELLQSYRSDIFCLQEFWLPNPNNAGVLSLYEEILGSEYSFIYHQRTGSKEDGVLIGYKKSKFKLISSRRIDFPGFFNFNRVGLLAHFETVAEIKGKKRDLFLGTTHIFFAENFLEYRVRNRQVRLMRDAIEDFATKNANGEDFTALLVGDFNAVLPSESSSSEEENEKQGYVSSIWNSLKETYEGEHWWESLRKYGYQSSYHAIHEGKPVVCSHIAHTNEHTECDFIFYKSQDIRPLASYLEPRNIDDGMLLLRPVTKNTEISYDAITGAASAEEFLSEWAKVSDHRPKTTVFEFVEKPAKL